MSTKVRPEYVIVKALGLFILVNVLFALAELPIEKISGYNILFPGRERIPFDNGNDPFIVTIDDVDAMLATHSISGRKNTSEIRVVLIGDSSVWGENLSIEETLSGQLNQLAYQCGGETIRAYNLGYPHPSILKDLILIEKAKEYQPDLIIWLITLNTAASHRINPFLLANRHDALRLLEKYDIPFESIDTLTESSDDFYKNTIVGQRSYLARLAKLQMLGTVWLATGKDISAQPKELMELSPDVRDNVEFRQLLPGAELEELLLLEALAAAWDIAGETPILLVNEPMYIATGLHSDVRYNDFYPRWVYDQYRAMMANEVQQYSWTYLDLWNVIPQEFFSDTPLHLDMDGERLLMQQISPFMHSMVCK